MNTYFTTTHARLRTTLGLTAAAACLTFGAAPAAHAEQPAAQSPATHNPAALAQPAGPTAASERVEEIVKLPFSERIYSVATYTDDPYQVKYMNWVSPERWAQLGYPAPKVVSTIPGRFTTYAWSTEKFMWGYEDDMGPLRLTNAQWVSMGSPKVSVWEGGYVKAANGDVVLWYPEGINGPHQFVSFAGWVNMGAPTPQTVPSLGHLLYTVPGSNDLYLSEYTGTGCSRGHHVTFNEWVGMGAPTPSKISDPRIPVCN